MAHGIEKTIPGDRANVRLKRRAVPGQAFCVGEELGKFNEGVCNCNKSGRYEGAEPEITL